MGDLATRTRLAAALGWAMNARVGRDRDERTEEPYVHLPTSSRSTGPGTDAGPSTLELKGCQWKTFRILAAVFSGRYEHALATLKELPYRRWREYDPEDSVRFYALLLHEAGMIKASPQKIIGERRGLAGSQRTEERAERLSCLADWPRASGLSATGLLARRDRGPRPVAPGSRLQRFVAICYHSATKPPRARAYKDHQRLLRFVGFLRG